MTHAESQPVIDVVPPQAPETGFLQDSAELLRGEEGFIVVAEIAAGVLGGIRKVLKQPLGKAAAGLGGVFLVGAGYGFVQSIRENVSTEVDVTASAKPAEYRGSFLYQMPKTCWGGYETDITGVTATSDSKINLPFGKTLDTYYKFSETKTGRITNIICSNEVQRLVTWDSRGIDATVSFKPTDFTSYVFDSDPSKTNYKSGNGIGAIPGQYLSSVLNGISDIPHVGDYTQGLADAASAPDKIDSKLIGITNLVSYMQATKACSPLAWKDLGGESGPLVTDIAQTIADGQNISPDHVHVQLPSTIQLDDQYETKYQDMKTHAEQQDGIVTTTVQFDYPAASDLKCLVSPNHNQVTVLPSGQLQPSGGAN